VRTVAALYDIHANLTALDAVLPIALEADLVVIGGDFAWGPQPVEVLERLRSLGPRASFLRGNTEREIYDASDPRGGWHRDRLSSEDLAFFESLPLTLSVDVDGLGPVLFCHGSPRADDEPMTTATSEASLRIMTGGVSEGVVVCGHTHVQFDRPAGERRVVNAGSVGLPFGEPGAHWVLLGPDVDHRITPYALEEAARAWTSSGAPGAEGYAQHILTPAPASIPAEEFTREVTEHPG
jgi:diadenosine tetraphosphatase ApaH/serine/threonine PP2A family protein phosphatase